MPLPAKSIRGALLVTPPSIANGVLEQRAAQAPGDRARAPADVLAERDPGERAVVLDVDVGRVGAAPGLALEGVQREVLRERGRSQAGEPARHHVRAPAGVGLAPGGDRVALGADGHARPRRSLPGAAGGVDVQRPRERRPRRAVQARRPDVAARRPHGVAVLVDAHVDGHARRAGVAQHDGRCGRLSPLRGRDDGREHLAARRPHRGQPAAVGGGDGRLGDAAAARELLGRLPDALVQAREEDLCHAAVALEVDDAAGAVAGDVDVAQRLDLGGAVDGLGPVPAGLGGGREGEQEQRGEGGDEAAHTLGSNRRGR